MLACVSSICLSFWQPEDLIFPVSVPLSCTHRWDLCGSPVAEFTALTTFPGWVQDRTWSQTAAKQPWCSVPMEIIHSGNTWQLSDEVYNGFKPDKKTKVFYEPKQRMLWTCVKKAAMPLWLFTQGGICWIPKSSRGIFSFQKKTAPSLGVKVALPSTTNLISPFLKILFQQWRVTVLASQKGLLHKQNLTYTNLIYWWFLKPVVITDKWSLFIPPVLPTPLFWSFRDRWKQRLHYSLEVHGHSLFM